MTRNKIHQNILRM